MLLSVESWKKKEDMGKGYIRVQVGEEKDEEGNTIKTKNYVIPKKIYDKIMEGKYFVKRVNGVIYFYDNDKKFLRYGDWQSDWEGSHHD